MKEPGANVGIMHVCSDNDSWTGSAALAVDDHHVVSVGGQPVLDGLAHGAQAVETWRQLLRPTQLHNVPSILLRQVRSTLRHVEDL